MEVKVGIADSSRELVINSALTPDEVQSAVESALGSANSVLELEDDKGRKYLIAGAKVSYVEIGVVTAGRVGFGVH